MPLRVEGRARTLRGPHPARCSARLACCPGYRRDAPSTPPGLLRRRLVLSMLGRTSTVVNFGGRIPTRGQPEEASTYGHSPSSL